MRRAITAISLLLVIPSSTRAVEQHSYVAISDLIVVGTLHPHSSYPGFWNRHFAWYMRGSIEVDEILFGETPRGNVEIEIVCPHPVCRLWPPTHLEGEPLEKGIWLLRNANGSWQTLEKATWVLSRWSLANRPWIDKGIREFKR